MKTGLYAIQDILSGLIIGPPMLHQHPTPAMRDFAEVLADTDPRNRIGKNPDDYRLIWLADITLTSEKDGAALALPAVDTGTGASGNAEVVLTGTAWKASQAPSTYTNATPQLVQEK